MNLLTYALLHFVSPFFSKQLINKNLTQNLVSFVSSVSHFSETKQGGLTLNPSPKERDFLFRV